MVANLVALYGMKLGVALLVLAVGFPVTGWASRALIHIWSRNGLDPSLHHFLDSIVKWGLRIGLLLMVGAMAGLEVTAFVAMLGGFAFAVGLALQGSLSNFAGGILIIVLRPFRVGDVIEAQGYSATVAAIHVFHTVLKTPDNRTIILPNGPLANGAVVNFTLEGQRRVDVTFSISYGDDVARARAVILRVVAAEARVLKEPAPLVHLFALADSSVNLQARVWARTPDYWEVLFGLQESVKRAFDEEGIEIPFPQRVVHTRAAT